MLSNCRLGQKSRRIWPHSRLWSSGRDAMSMKKRLSGLIAIVIACVLLAPGCTGVARYRYEQPLNVIDDACRTWYEVFVPSFEDSNGDGTGDLAGLTSRL